MTHHHGGGATTSPSAGSAPHRVSASTLLLTLGILGAVAGALVVTVYRVTEPAVQRYAAERSEAAIREVLKSPTRWDTLYLVGDSLTANPPIGMNRSELPKAFVGRDGTGKRIGVAVTAEEPGFQQELLLMIGFDPATGGVTGIKVLDQKETPGLGDKIEADSFQGQFPGRIAPLRGVKGAPGTGSEVQTITGATISSRAVIRIVNHAVARWQPLLLAHDRDARQ